MFAKHLSLPGLRTKWISLLVVATLVAVGACESSGGTHNQAAGSTQPTTTAAAASTTTTVASTLTTLASATVVGAPRPAGALAMAMVKLSFDPGAFSVKSGKLVLFLANQEQVPAANADQFFRHDFVLTANGAGASGPILAQSKDFHVGESGVFTIDHIAPGAYEYYCTYHLSNSQMEGTLTVTP